MKKILLLLGVMLMSVVAMAQYPVTASTLYITDSIAMDTNRVTQLGEATDDYDAVPFWQIQDSITAGAATATYWTRLGDLLYPETITDSVGIGTSTPTQQLDIKGNIKVDSSYYDSNNDEGSTGQMLSSTVTGTDWINAIDTTRIYDSLAVYLDTLQVLRVDINDNYDSLMVHRTQINKNIDILS